VNEKASISGSNWHRKARIETVQGVFAREKT
jgi:hypothetical protein